MVKLINTLDPIATGRPVTILYVRLSSEEQANGSGLDRQLSAVKLWCVQERVEEAILLEDVGLSAFVGAHITKGRMGELLTAAKAGRVAPGSVLVMENLDRLSRDNPLEAIQILIDFLNRGIDVVTTTDRNRYSRSGNSSQAMTTLVLGALHFGRSNSESELKSSRVSDAWTIKIEQARSSLAPHGKRCPAWIRLGPNGYEPIDERVKEIKWMFAQATAGKGRRQIVKALIDRDVPPWTEPSEKRKKPAWSDSYIQKILTGCEAYGTYRPSRTPNKGPKVFLDPIPGYYPAAVSYEVAARARAAAATRQGSGGRKGKFVNIFQGLCVCSACGKGMTLEDKGRRSSGPKLICQRATLADCEHRFRYDYAFLEPSVIFIIRQRADALLAASKSEVEELGSILDRRKTRLEAVTSGMGRLAKQMELVDDDGTLARNFMALVVQLRGGGSGKIVAQRSAARRPNPGQFVSRRDSAGNQMRRGRGDPSRST